MCKFGVKNYWMDLSNYMDFSFIAFSGVMAIFHSFPDIGDGIGVGGGPLSNVGRILMLLVILCSIRRTFNFMRIFSAFCNLVTMMNNVIFQLRIFMTFFAIMITLFTLMFAVLGIGNVNIPGDY